MDCHVGFRGKSTYLYLRLKMLQELGRLDPDSLESWWSVDHCLSSWTLLGDDFIYSDFLSDGVENAAGFRVYALFERDTYTI